MSAFNLGSFWVILVILMCWDPITDELYVLLVFAIGGAFFGAPMTFWNLRVLRGKKVWVNDNFDRSKWLSRGGAFKVMHFSRTPVLLLLFYLMMAGAPKGSSDEAYLMFMMVFVFGAPAPSCDGWFQAIWSGAGAVVEIVRNDRFACYSVWGNDWFRSVRLMRLGWFGP